MKINALEDLLGVSKATIRYYEDQGLVTPLRMENGYRDYSDEEVQLFQRIIVLRKLGLSIPEIRELIDGKANLHDTLTYNLERLHTHQDEIAVAMKLCEQIKSEASDFTSIDSPKYLKHIYEDEQKGVQFAEAKEISVRQLNLAVTLLGALAGVPAIQNKQFSEHSHEQPLPADIRANKKDGDEYATIGNVIEKGGKLKAVLIAVAVLFLALAIGNGFLIWGGLGFAGKYIFDYNRSGITVLQPDSEELAQLTAIDPEAVGAGRSSELFKFRTNKGLLLTLRGPENGEWAELDSRKIDAEEGYLFVTGDPSSDLEIHVIVNRKSTRYSTRIDDNAHKEKGTKTMINSYQTPLQKEEAIVLFYRADNAWTSVDDSDLYSDILKEAPPDGCYAVVVQDAE